MKLTWLAPLVLVTSSCSPSVHCEPAPRALTGDFATDLVGAYGSWGIDTQVIYEFRADGRFNAYSFGTSTERPSRQPGYWAVDGGVLYLPPFAPAGIAQSEISFSESALSLYARSHDRLTCNGPGFDEP